MAKARIAVIGAGLMGHGIAQVFALAGHEVAIYDSVMASLDSATARIAANLKELDDDPKAVELDRYIDLGGYKAARKVVNELTAAQVIDTTTPRSRTR